MSKSSCPDGKINEHPFKRVPRHVEVQPRQVFLAAETFKLRDLDVDAIDLCFELSGFGIENGNDGRFVFGHERFDAKTESGILKYLMKLGSTFSCSL